MSQPTAPKSFAAAAREVLGFLQKRLGHSLWMVTRAQGEDCIVLDFEDRSYGMEAHSVFRWADSYCSRMVSGLGPRIAPSSDAIPAYREASYASQMKIGSYVGVPLTRSDGSLFGTLCAIDPAPRPERIVEELPLIELLAGMLSALLSTELASAESARRAERARQEAETDALTGLGNRRAWDRLLAAEDARCRLYGHCACVLAIDLDGLKAANDSEGHAAGDRLIRKAAGAVLSAARECDVVARVGGDEFAILAVECDLKAGRRIEERLEGALERAGVAASIGVAARVPSADLGLAWRQADESMYRAKTARRAGRFATV